MSRIMRKPIICICKNNDPDQLRGNREADQHLCFHHYFKLLASFCACTARFVSNLFGNHIVGFSTRRLICCRISFFSMHYQIVSIYSFLSTCLFITYSDKLLVPSRLLVPRLCLLCDLREVSSSVGGWETVTSVNKKDFFSRLCELL